MGVAPDGMKEAVRAVREGDRAALVRCLDLDEDLAGRPRLIVEAARAKGRGAIEELLRRGADPDASYRRYRPLHALVQEDVHRATADDPERIACLDLLLACGADPEKEGGFPETRATLLAAFAGARALVARLRAVAASDGFTAAAYGVSSDVRRAVAADPKFASRTTVGGLTALMCACASRLGARDRGVRRRLSEIVDLLLDAGADPNARVRSWGDEVDTAYFAASAGASDRFRRLLERGADPTSALTSAVWNAGLDFAEIALSFGAEPDRARHDGRPLLAELVRWGQVEKAIWLLRAGAHPDTAGEDGWTALHHAVSRGNARILDALLESGADPALRTRDGRTARDIAAERKRDAILDRLPPARPGRRRRGSRGTK